MTTRPQWDNVWMSVAETIATRSRCVRRQIGAVIVTPKNRPIAVGYNGPPALLLLGDDDSECDQWCARGRENSDTYAYNNCITVHAEANALLFADRRDYENGTIYVTSVPCWECGKMIANSGLGTVVTKLGPNDAHRLPSRTIEMLEAAGVTVVVQEV